MSELRLVSTWNMCRSAASMVSKTRSMKLDGDLLVKQVAHGVDEDHAGLLPRERLGQPLGAQGQVEAVFEGMAGRVSEALGQKLGVAVVAATGDLGAAGNGIPGPVGPFDLGHDAIEGFSSDRNDEHHQAVDQQQDGNERQQTKDFLLAGVG